MKGENEMAEKVFSLINIDEVDKNIHKEFYPRISHVQRKKLIDCIKRRKKRHISHKYSCKIKYN